jgi:hypothetical protein
MLFRLLSNLGAKGSRRAVFGAAVDAACPKLGVQKTFTTIVTTTPYTSPLRVLLTANMAFAWKAAGITYAPAGCSDPFMALTFAATTDTLLLQHE